MICRKESNLVPCTLYETDKDIGEKNKVLVYNQTLYFPFS